MNFPPPIDLTPAEAHEATQKYGSIFRAAEALGCSRQTVRRRLRAYDGLPPRGGDGASLAAAMPKPSGKPDMQVEYGEDSGKVTLERTRIKTLEQALAAAEVDLSTWAVDRYIVNKWEVGAKDGENKLKVEPLFQVKVWLKRKIKIPHAVAIENLCASLEVAPVAPAPQFCKSTSPHALEIDLPDHHFGKYAWEAETGQDYDLVIAERIFVDAVADLLNKARGFDMDEIIFPIGNDFLHINNASGTTEKGTRLDVDTRLALVAETGLRAVVRSVELMRQHAPLVRIVWVRGNHDPLTSWYLCRVLDAYYRHDAGMVVDVSPKSRKCIVYGKTLIGYTHGSEEPHRDLPSIMAGEWPQEWAATVWRQWHTGHTHKKKQIKHLGTDTYVGVEVKVLQSLSALDAWHYSKGYVNNMRAAEANLYSRERGPVATFFSNLEAGS